MAITDDRTTQRNWRKPSIDNDLDVDVERLRLTLDEADTDLADALQTATAAKNAADGAGQAAQAATAAAAQAAGAAGAARLLVAVTANDTAPAGLQAKIEVTGALVEELVDAGEDERLRLSIRDASMTQRGAVQLATEAETLAGLDDSRAVHPKGLLAALASAAAIRRTIRTSNVQLAANDRGRYVDVVSGSFTQTFAGCSTLGDGWYAYLSNSGTGDVTLDPSGTDLIDGLASYKMYPGEVRLVFCDGSALRSIILECYSKLFTASDTFIRPPGYVAHDADGIGAGAGGAGGGTRKSNSQDIYAGGGGGGGGRRKRRIYHAELGSTVAITVGAGGNGGAGAPAGSLTDTGAAGTNGGATSVGALLAAPGGIAGTPGGQGGLNNGGKGGEHAALAGNPRFAGGGSISAGTAPLLPEMGGGGGGRSGEFWNPAGPGGRSLEGGPGGGGGGGGDPTNGSFFAAFDGAPGGAPWASGTATIGGGAVGGGHGGFSQNGFEGATGSTPAGAMAGNGGGGGGGGGQQGGDGGDGGRAAGGGGGGTGHAGRGGHGGNGGDGAVRMTGVV